MWFHTGITRETAEEQLEHSSSGCFLVRESKTKVGCFSLSLKHPEGIAHFTIERKDSGLYELTGTHKGFRSLPDLIDHFKNHPISEDPYHQLHYPCSKFIHSGEGRSAWLAQTLPTPSHNLDPSSLTDTAPSVPTQTTPPSVPTQTILPPLPPRNIPPLVPTQTTPPPVPLPRRRGRGTGGKHIAWKHTANTSFKGKRYPNGKRWQCICDMHLPNHDLLRHSNHLVKYVHVPDQFCACHNAIVTGLNVDLSVVD